MDFQCLAMLGLVEEEVEVLVEAPIPAIIEIVHQSDEENLICLCVEGSQICLPEDEIPKCLCAEVLLTVIWIAHLVTLTGENNVIGAETRWT